MAVRAGVPSRVRRAGKAGSVPRLRHSSIKWFDGVFGRKRQRPGGEGKRERRRGRESERASLSSQCRGCAAEHTNQHAPFPLFLPVSLSLPRVDARAHRHARTHALLVTGTQECRGSAVCSRSSSSSSSSLSRKTRFFPSSELDPPHPHPPLVHESKSSRQEPPPPPIY